MEHDSQNTPSSPDLMTLPQRLEWAASMFPEEVALAGETGALSYRVLEEVTRGTALRLLAGFIQPGDKIAVIGENSLEHMTSLFAVFRAGCCLIPLSTFLSDEAAARILDDAGPRVALTQIMHGERESDPIAGGQRDRHRIGKIAAMQRMEGGPGGGGGAASRRPSTTQFGLRACFLHQMRYRTVRGFCQGKCRWLIRGIRHPRRAA